MTARKVVTKKVAEAAAADGMFVKLPLAPELVARAREYFELGSLLWDAGATLLEKGRELAAHVEKDRRTLARRKAHPKRRR